MVGGFTYVAGAAPVRKAADRGRLASHRCCGLAEKTTHTHSVGALRAAGGTPFKRRRFHPKLSRRQKAVNRARARIRTRGEPAVATLKTWKIQTELRCCRRRATAIVQPSPSCATLKPTATQDERGSLTTL